MNSQSRVFLTGHRGLLGSTIEAEMLPRCYDTVITRTRQELDLRDQAAVRQFFKEEKIDTVIHCAAKVGGIVANKTYPADFISENLQIQTNVICAAHEADVN